MDFLTRWSKDQKKSRQDNRGLGEKKKFALNVGESLPSITWTIKGTVSRDGKRTRKRADNITEERKGWGEKTDREYKRAEERTSKGSYRIEYGGISKGPGGQRGYPEGETGRRISRLRAKFGYLRGWPVNMKQYLCSLPSCLQKSYPATTTSKCYIFAFMIISLKSQRETLPPLWGFGHGQSTKCMWEPASSLPPPPHPPPSER